MAVAQKNRAEELRRFRAESRREIPNPNQNQKKKYKKPLPRGLTAGKKSNTKLGQQKKKHSR